MQRSALFLVTLAPILAGCTITHSVDPIGNRPIPALLCFQENDTVWSKEFLPWLQEEFQRHRFETKVFQGARPEECRLYATYKADWDWDVALYLSYAEINLFEDSDLVGRVVYDATGGSGTFSKFGRTEEKLRPLINELLYGITLSHSETSSPEDTE